LFQTAVHKTIKAKEHAKNILKREKKTTENKITTQQCLQTTERSDCMTKAMTSKQNMRVMHNSVVGCWKSELPDILYYSMLLNDAINNNN